MCDKFSMSTSVIWLAYPRILYRYTSFCSSVGMFHASNFGEPFFRGITLWALCSQEGNSFKHYIWKKNPHTRYFLFIYLETIWITLKIPNKVILFVQHFLNTYKMYIYLLNSIVLLKCHIICHFYTKCTWYTNNQVS